MKELAEKFGSDLGHLENLAREMRIEKLLNRDLHVGFSGGEMKRAEILLLAAQRPKIALLDEPDSGIDIDSLPVIGKAINNLLEVNGPKAVQKRSALIITHLGKISEYVPVSRAFVMIDGKIMCYGDADAILRDIERYGFKGCRSCVMEREGRRIERNNG